jgi:A/G-specific adenine glycosylase
MRGGRVRTEWWGVPGIVSHTFTDFKLESLVYRSLVGIDAALTFWADPQRCEWVPRRDLDRVALPSVMRKIIAHGLREM